MGDTPVGRTWDRCEFLTTDLRHHSNNRRAVVMFQIAGHDVSPALHPYECGGGFSAKCTPTPVNNPVASKGQKDLCTRCGDKRALLPGAWHLCL